MKIRMTTSVAMVALAAVGLSLPVPTPAVAQSNTDVLEVQVPSAGIETIEDALYQKVDRTKKLVIQLDPAQGPYELPAYFERLYREVQIESADQSNQNQARLVQATADGMALETGAGFDGPAGNGAVQASVAYLPLTLEGVKIDNVQGTVIDAFDSVNLKQVAFEGNGTAVFSREHRNDVLASRSDRNAVFNVASKLSITDSSFKDVELANIRQAFKHVTIVDNTYTYANATYPGALTLGPVSYGDGRVRIERNNFFYKKSDAVGAAVTIMRPNVRIDDNVFSGNSDNVAALELIVPRYRGYPVSHLVHEVRVTENAFDMDKVFVHNVKMRGLNQAQVNEVLAADDLKFFVFSNNHVERIKKADSTLAVLVQEGYKLHSAQETIVVDNEWADGEL